ncbi:MAG: hypothetical protein JJT76_18935 [Clostridiaceae bacterium]|nr:hypothetical protein [Clostridiaceae bacterium]
MEVLNHSSMTITKRYLSITKDEINEAYLYWVKFIRGVLDFKKVFKVSLKKRELYHI